MVVDRQCVLTLAVGLLGLGEGEVWAQVPSDCAVEVVGRVRGSEVNMRSGAGMNFPAPNYVLVGQTVVLLNNAQGRRIIEYDRQGYDWYFVEYPPSRARGWIRADLLSPFCTQL